MARILLADDSSHAQRMGERILSEEGYEVVTVSDGESALIRLADVDPDLVLADAVMPKRSGYEVCQFVKMNPRHRHTRVLVTVGALELLDEQELKRVHADGSIQKPFEASALLEAVKPLLAAAVSSRDPLAPAPTKLLSAPASPPPPADRRIVAVIDTEQVHAAVTIALDAAMPALVEEITDKVLVALKSRIDRA
jgi:CheY-like chemotaxis protein